MLAEEVRLLARELMDDHGLESWSVEINPRLRTTFGRCNHNRQLIDINWYHCTRSEADTIRDTILHEIAHALVGRRQGHNHVWRAKAIEIGCSGSRTGKWEDDVLPTTITARPWAMVCPAHGVVAKRKRKPRARYTCKECGACVTYERKEDGDK